MIYSKFRSVLTLSTAVLLLLATGVLAQESQININQTEGFAEGQELVFTYTQQFFCTHEPFQDLDHNGLVAAVDPNEFQRSICAVGEQPTINPVGAPVDQTDKLFVIVPFFGNDTNPSDAFTAKLGETLIKLFGFVPEAFKKHPAVPVQCPEPGPPETAHKGMPGSCTMHTTRLDLGPALAKLGKVPPNTNFFVPSPNHSHIIEETNQSAEWWQIFSVLVTDPSVWPDEEGTKGITSVDALRAAQAAGKATQEAPTNFFLFFSVAPE
jgi:hypothetical protein